MYKCLNQQKILHVFVVYCVAGYFWRVLIFKRPSVIINSWGLVFFENIFSQALAWLINIASWTCSLVVQWLLLIFQACLTALRPLFTALPSVSTKAAKEAVPVALEQLKDRCGLMIDYLAQVKRQFWTNFNFLNVFINMITTHYEGDFKWYFW